MKNQTRFQKLFTGKLFKVAAGIIAVTSLSFCGPQNAGDETETTEVSDSTTTGVGGTTSQSGVDADTPADSTGAFGTVKLNISTAENVTALALADETSTLDLGNGVIITDARINIAAVKLKSDKEMSDKEARVQRKNETQKEGIWQEHRGSKGCGRS